jgi:hypothetical protein
MFSVTPITNSSQCVCATCATARVFVAAEKAHRCVAYWFHENQLFLSLHSCSRDCFSQTRTLMRLGARLMFSVTQITNSSQCVCAACATARVFVASEKAHRCVAY